MNQPLFKHRKQFPRNLKTKGNLMRTTMKKFISTLHLQIRKTPLLQWRNLHSARKHLEPNEVIFTTLLSACSHTGMIAEGWRCFNSLCKDYNFKPLMKHYACMVDLLTRAGKLEEALEFIERMPIQPDVSFFGAFLHGCGLYSRFDLGEVAIRRMLELHPDEACFYVLMCNLYASDGRWSRVNQVREPMKQRGLSKSLACSQVEMDIRNHIAPVRVACVA